VPILQTRRLCFRGSVTVVRETRDGTEVMLLHTGVLVHWVTPALKGKEKATWGNQHRLDNYLCGQAGNMF
jgi:hypothetical protein